MLWTKRAHQCTIFRLFGALMMKVHPIPHANFETTRSGFPNFASLFNVMRGNSSVLFQLKPHILWIKIAHGSEIFGLLSAWVKITKFHMSFLNTQLSFSLNFASFFNAMGVKSSVLFQLKLNLIFTKATHHSANFQTFNCSGEISPNFYFDRLLLLKVYKVSAKKSVEELCLVIPRSHNLHHPPPITHPHPPRLSAGVVEPPTKF